MVIMLNKTRTEISAAHIVSYLKQKALEKAYENLNGGHQDEARKWLALGASVQELFDEDEPVAENGNGHGLPGVTSEAAQVVAQKLEEHAQVTKRKKSPFFTTKRYCKCGVTRLGHGLSGHMYHRGKKEPGKHYEVDSKGHKIKS